MTTQELMLDPDFADLINAYNQACEHDDEGEWIANEGSRLVEFGAWVDATGHWRHPKDDDPRTLDEILGEQPDRAAE